MAWFRVHLTEEQQRIVNEERVAHPDLRVREKMLVLWLLHCGAKRSEKKRPRSSASVGPPSTGTSPPFARGAWSVSGRATTIVPKARWRPIAT
jgi:hypothetical protein